MGNPLSTLVAKLAFLPPAASYEVDWQELLWLRTKRGQRIPAVFVPWPGAKFTILFSHANAEDLGLIFGHLKTLSEVLQVNVMGYEYTGYGQSTGTPSEAACYDDIVAAFGWLIKEKNLLPNEVILFGRSIGSGPTVELASRAEVGGIILQSAFTSCIRVAYDLKHTVGDIFCNIKKLHKVKCPALIIHGTRDDVVTLQHGKALFSLAQICKELFKRCRRPYRPFWVKGASHNNIETEHFQEYCQRLQDFVWSLDPKWKLQPGTVFAL